MAEPFLAEIRMMSFNFPPKGWALANGQTLPINQNQALFSLLGTTYGGNGQTTFALPDLRGSVAIHFGEGFTLGEKLGQSAHTITQSEMPQHIHFLQGTSNTANNVLPTNSLPALTPNVIYSSGGAQNLACKPNSVGNVGGSQPHENRMPSTVISFCIALQGIFPSQT
jgi:microcystin-dependent protein